MKPWTPQQAGRDWEVDWAALFGTKPIKGSGSFWYAKQDVNDGTILWSLKWTDAKSFSIQPGLLHEVSAAIREFGIDATPGLAVNVRGTVFTTLFAEDMIHALTEIDPYIAPSKAEARRQSSRVPALLRGDSGS